MSITTSLKDVLLGAGITPTGHSATELMEQMVGAFEPKLGATPTGTTDAYCLTQYDGDTSPAWNTIEDALGYTPMPSFNLSNIFNNAGNPHIQNTDFNALPATYAAHYVAMGSGSTPIANGPPIPGATSFYGFTMGVGTPFTPSSYAGQIYWPRASMGGSPYLSVRFRENGSWTAWSKVHAGYADTAGNSTTTSQTTFGSLNVGSASGATAGGIFARAAANDSGYYFLPANGAIIGSYAATEWPGAGSLAVGGGINVGSATGATAGQIKASNALLIGDGITAPSATSGYATIYVDSADGDLKIKFGDGVTKTIMTDT